MQDFLKCNIKLLKRYLKIFITNTDVKYSVLTQKKSIGLKIKNRSSVNFPDPQILSPSLSFFPQEYKNHKRNPTVSH